MKHDKRKKKGGSAEDGGGSEASEADVERGSTARVLITDSERSKDAGACTAKEVCTNLVFWCLFILTCYVTMMFAINSARRFKQDGGLDGAAAQEKHHAFHHKVINRHMYDNKAQEYVSPYGKDRPNRISY